MKKSYINILTKKALYTTAAIAISGILPATSVLAHGELVANEFVAQENTVISGKPGETITVPVQIELVPDGGGKEPATDAATVTVNLGGQTQHNKTLEFAASEFNTPKIIDLKYTIPEGTTPGPLSLEVIMTSNVTTGNNQVWNKDRDYVTIQVVADSPAPADTTAPILTLVNSINGIFNAASLPAGFEFSLDESSEVFVNGESKGFFDVGTHSLALPTPIQGLNTVTLFAVDAAKNKSEEVSFSYMYDSIEPVVTGAPDSSPNENGWYNKDVTVTFTAEDEQGGSGVDESSVSAPVTVTEDGTHEIIGTAKDYAGNTGSSDPITIKFDKTAPVFEGIENGRAYKLNQVVNWTASDATSGLASEESGTLDTSTVGEKSITVKDQAGNEIEIHYTVEYDFGGVLQPINQNGTSIFKAGSTVPVKIQLKDANGAFVTDAIASIYYQKISTDASGVEEAISTSAATTGNFFRYDLNDNQYIFNLSTKGLTSGTYQLSITLNDGQTYNVQIGLK